MSKTHNPDSKLKKQFQRTLQVIQDFDDA